MKNPSAPRRLLLAALALCLLSTTGSAHHLTYLGEDQAFQDSRWSGVENYVFYWWSAAPASLWWWAEADLEADAKVAVTSWQDATGFPFFQVWSRDAADVVIIEDNSMEAFGMLELTAIVADPSRNANYTYRAQATIRNAGEEPVGGWQATIAHELGHVFGLHEAYRDSGETEPFCSNQTTLMNSGSCPNRPLQPSSLDVSELVNLYQNGELLAMNTTSSWFTSSLYLTWRDGAWGEYEHRLYLYWWDGTKWAQVDSASHTDDTGGREISWNSRILSRSFSRTQLGRPAGWYRVCGHPLFRHGGTGAWRCSNTTWVS